MIRREKKSKPLGGPASGWTSRIRVQNFRVYFLKTAWIFGVCPERFVICVVAFNYYVPGTKFQHGINFGR